MDPTHTVTQPNPTEPIGQPNGPTHGQLCAASDWCGFTTQVPLNQWAHWARAQGHRIFFLFEGPPLANYLIVGATA